MPRWNSDALFVTRQLRCCVFALLIVGLLAVSSVWPPGGWGTARYDALVAGCLLAQLGLIWARVLALVLAFRRARVAYTVAWLTLHMPLLLSFALIGLAVLVAENGATYLGAWVYPHQQGSWQPVYTGRWLAWTLLVVVAFLIVSVLKTWEARLAAMSTAGGRNRQGPLRSGQARGPAPRAR